jgi:hypothetical protein
MDLREIGWTVGDWIRLAQDGDWWRDVVNAAMSLRVLAPRSHFVNTVGIWIRCDCSGPQPVSQCYHSTRTLHGEAFGVQLLTFMLYDKRNFRLINARRSSCSWLHIPLRW